MSKKEPVQVCKYASMIVLNRADSILKIALHLRLREDGL